MVVECAGSVMGPLAAVVGGDAMLGSLPALLSPLIDRLVGHSMLKLSLMYVTSLLLCQKPTSTVADRSFAIGTLAEVCLLCV